jgi:hypothetical protein
MKMDRNLPENAGAGKYAVINLRKLRELCPGATTFEQFSPGVTEALRVLDEVGALEWGRTGEPDEFFLIKLKDRNAYPALNAYANSAEPHDAEWAAEVRELAERSGMHSPWCKEPD